MRYTSHPSDFHNLVVFDPDVSDEPGVPRPQAARSQARGPTLQPPTLPSRGPPPASPPRYHPPHQVYLVVQVHRTTDMVGDYLQLVTNFEVAVFVHREHPMLLCEPLQHGARVSDNVAVPLQVQGLRAWGYIGSEGLAAAVDYGQVPGRPTHHRAHHYGCAFVERAGTETGLHPIVEYVGSGSDLRHPFHLRHMLRRRSRAHADVVHPYAPLPHQFRQEDHELSLFEPSLPELQRLYTTQNCTAVSVDSRQIQVAHGLDLTCQPDGFIKRDPGTPQAGIHLEPDLERLILRNPSEPPCPFEAVHPDDEPNPLSQPNRLPDLRFRHQRIGDKDILDPTISHDLSLRELGHRDARSPCLQLFPRYTRDLMSLHVGSQHNTVLPGQIGHLLYVSLHLRAVDQNVRCPGRIWSCSLTRHYFPIPNSHSTIRDASIFRLFPASADYEGRAYCPVCSSTIRLSATASTFRLLYSNGTVSSVAHGPNRSE